MHQNDRSEIIIYLIYFYVSENPHTMIAVTFTSGQNTLCYQVGAPHMLVAPTRREKRKLQQKTQSCLVFTLMLGPRNKHRTKSKQYDSNPI